MTSVEFAYWLQGLFELAGPKTLDERQTRLVRQHLALVFQHDIDPKAGGDQAALQATHDGTAPPKIGGQGPGGMTFRC